MRVLDQLLHVITLKSVEYVEEVLAIRNSALGHLRGEMPHEQLVRLHHRPELHDCELVIDGNIHSLDLIEFQETLLLGEYLFQEILVEHVLGRQVQLH